jgi:hypothetical protein
MLPTTFSSGDSGGLRPADLLRMVEEGLCQRVSDDPAIDNPTAGRVLDHLLLVLDEVRAKFLVARGEERSP